MKIYQQRVPIISPLDRDYYRTAFNSGLASKHMDEPSSLNPQASFNTSQSAVENSDISPNISDTVNLLGFTIVGEREVQ